MCKLDGDVSGNFPSFAPNCYAAARDSRKLPVLNQPLGNSVIALLGIVSSPFGNSLIESKFLTNILNTALLVLSNQLFLKAKVNLARKLLLHLMRDMHLMRDN